jgi:hypothetical protein
MTDKEKDTQEVEDKETVDSQDDFEIEVVDDTPAEDKGKVPLKAGDSPEPTEDELENYSEKVQNRIGKLKRAYHDERRAKEAKDREAVEAYNYAKALQEENRKLKENLSKGETTLMETSKARADAEIAAAKEAYRKAYEEGDSDKIIEAQEKLAKATYAKEKSDSYTPQYQYSDKDLQKEEKEGYNQQNVPKPDPKAEAWFKKNTWFGSDDEMTALAYGLHEKLVKSGVDPRSDEYYEKIDSRMKEVFPDRFDDESADNLEDEPKSSQQKAKAPANVVAPVKRSPSSKKITLSQTQVALAKKLGVPLEEYAKQVARLNG